MEYFYTSLPPAALLPRPPRPTIDLAIARRIVSIGGASGGHAADPRSQAEAPRRPVTESASEVVSES